MISDGPTEFGTDCLKEFNFEFKPVDQTSINHLLSDDFECLKLEFRYLFAKKLICYKYRTASLMLKIMILVAYKS